MDDRAVKPDARLDQLTSWLAQQLGALPERPEPASADASFRRYFRVAGANGPVIAMDAPPEHENLEAFVQVAALLEEAALHAPRILAADHEQGFLLLEDLGSTTYLDAIAHHDAERLYGDALDALVRWQASTRPDDTLPAYDETLLRRELDLFPDWYVRAHLGREPDAAWLAHWENTCRTLIDTILDQPVVRVHRDYTPRNLMVAEPNPGIIDFQDAVTGPITYDWVSLVRDAFTSWPPATEDRWLLQWHQRARAAGLPVPTQPADLRRDVDFMACQRHLKVIGIFARLFHRDGKPHYLVDIPRFFAYLERQVQPWPELAPLRTLLADLPVSPAGAATS